jgi:hypothetical protein
MKRKLIAIGMLVCSWWLVQAMHAQSLATAKKPVGVLIFRLRLNRMEPSQLTVPEGRYNIHLINGISLSDFDFQLNDERDTQLASKRVQQARGVSNMPVDLTPGRQVLSIAGRPKYRCEITVTSDKVKAK